MALYGRGRAACALRGFGIAWLAVLLPLLAAVPATGEMRLRVEPSPKPGTNLVANYSFEAVGDKGIPEGWAWDRRNTDATAQVVEADPHSGRRCLKLTNGTPYGAHVYGALTALQPIRLIPGASYTLSCYARGAEPGLLWLGGGSGWRLRMTV
ncbi:MAG TPA: carbohydrate binding domain-containing protein, partial [Armatimonadota bacterium]